MSSFPLMAAVAGSLALATSVGFVATSEHGAPAQGVQQSSAPQGEPVGGIACDPMEGMRTHIHQHLTLLDHGKSIVIPPNVGQIPARRCLYWVHSHTSDGIIHIESPQARSFTLADFFAIWGQPLSPTQVASMHAAKGTSFKVWVNDKPFTGDLRKIELAAHTVIVIEAGPPFPKPPKFADWGPL